MKHINSLLALSLLIAPTFNVNAQDHAQHTAAAARQSNDAVMLSTPGRRAASQEIVVASDGSINVTWVETMSDKAVMSEHNLRAAGADHSQHSAGAKPAAQSEVKVGNDVMFARSTDGGRTFTKPVRVNSAPGEVRGVNGNKPRVAIDAKGVIHIAWVAANQTEKAFGLDIRYAKSVDGGKSFTASRTINEHQTPIDPITGMGNTHAFVGMTLTPKGALHFYWIDTRHMTDAKGSAAMVTTATLDGGKTFTKERELFGTGICGCCQIDALTAADGTMYLSWRNVYENNARETVVSRSTDGGKTWTDLGPKMTMGGYNATLVGGTSANPLAGQMAFGGESTNFEVLGVPGYVTTTVELGTAYAGKTVQVRFRGGTDQASGFSGWFVQQVAFNNLKNTPFGSRVADRGLCVPEPTSNIVIKASSDAARVPSGYRVQLLASTVEDAGKPVTFTWSQVSGPQVTLSSTTGSNPHFNAPTVTSDTELVFQAIGSDGTLTSSPQSVTIKVIAAANGSTGQSSGCTYGGPLSAPAASSGLSGLLLAGAALLSRRRRK